MSTPAPGLNPLPERLVFGRFELRPLEQQLLDGGVPLPLGGRAFDLLLALVQRAGRVVPRNELIEAVWPGLVVEENNLSVQINALRKALGAELLVTVPGRGYRFVAPVLQAHPGAPAAPPAVAPAPPRTHLPTTQPLLIGRSEDLAALGTLIDQHRLVTLVGPGGIGKTRLAQALLSLRVTSYPQGVCWVELGGVSDAAALPGAVATALGVRPAPGAGLAGLAQALGGLQMLVALDNAEHLVADVAALVQALLAAAPGLRLLVTSQAPLKLAEERVFTLAGLAVPQGPLPAQQAQAFGAVALFAERAQAADSRFVLSDAQAQRVIELCRSLDGLALAIELAAARVPLLGIDALVAALPERLKVLTGNRNRAAPARQQTLRAALVWSHGLLGAREQRLFRRMGAIAGPAPLALLQAVGLAPDDEDAGDPWALLDALDELVQRSLVEANVSALADGSPGEPRYRLLESPRALAREHLAASSEAAAVRQRHALAVLRLLDEAEAAMEAGTLGVEAWRQQFELELDNAREALAHAAAAGDERLLLALGAALLPGLPAALHAERQALADRVEALLPGCGDAALRRRAWAALSTALANAHPQRSRHAAEQALAEARRLAIGDERARWHLVQALCEAADVVVDDDEAVQAQALLDEATALQDPAWPPVRQRCTARLRASIAAARGQAAEALHGWRELLRLSRAAGDPSLMTQINLADTELWAGDAQAAVALGRALVAQLSGLRDDNHLAYARLNLAAACLALGDTHEAESLLREGWAAARRVQRLSWWADHAALLAVLRGRPDAAAQLLGAADARYALADEARQINEARESERVVALCTAALGEAGLRELRERGRALPDELLPGLALEPR